MKENGDDDSNSENIGDVKVKVSKSNSEILKILFDQKLTQIIECFNSKVDENNCEIIKNCINNLFNLLKAEDKSVSFFDDDVLSLLCNLFLNDQNDIYLYCLRCISLVIKSSRSVSHVFENEDFFRHVMVKFPSYDNIKLIKYLLLFSDSYMKYFISENIFANIVKMTEKTYLFDSIYDELFEILNIILPSLHDNMLKYIVDLYHHPHNKQRVLKLFINNINERTSHFIVSSDSIQTFYIVTSDCCVIKYIFKLVYGLIQFNHDNLDYFLSQNIIKFCYDILVLDNNMLKIPTIKFLTNIVEMRPDVITSDFYSGAIVYNNANSTDFKKLGIRLYLFSVKLAMCDNTHCVMLSSFLGIEKNIIDFIASSLNHKILNETLKLVSFILNLASKKVISDAPHLNLFQVITSQKFLEQLNMSLNECEDTETRNFTENIINCISLIQ